MNDTVAITDANIMGIRGDQQDVIQGISVREPAGAWVLTVQWTELGFFLTLSALLTWFCFRRLRHVA